MVFYIILYAESESDRRIDLTRQVFEIFEVKASKNDYFVQFHEFIMEEHNFFEYSANGIV